MADSNSDSEKVELPESVFVAELQAWISKVDTRLVAVEKKSMLQLCRILNQSWRDLKKAHRQSQAAINLMRYCSDAVECPICGSMEDEHNKDMPCAALYEALKS
jgi:DNA repair exonuclease SbcCD ATPase subunit